jgi:hypothetical protein
MAIELLPDADDVARFAFDSGWDRLTLRLRETEFATYYVDSRSAGFSATLHAFVRADAEIAVTWAGREHTISVPASEREYARTIECDRGCGSLKVQVVKGVILLNAITIAAETP